MVTVMKADKKTFRTLADKRQETEQIRRREI